MALYNYSTFGQLKAQLARLLSDELMVFWQDSELGIYLNAALREWNSIARTFRDRGTFTTNTTDTFYDLRDVLENGAGEKFLDPVITDAQLLTQAKLMLMEPSVGFTDGLSQEDFDEAFARRRHQFQLETGLVISETTAQVITSGAGRVQFVDDSIIDIRRASWLSLDGAYTTLYREDGFVSQSFTPTWAQQSATPRRYSIYPDPLLTLQLLPPPSDNGSLILQTISSGEVLDDFTPFILWGVLADVLSNSGPSNDPLRVEYCEARWKEGIIVGRQVVTVQQAFINGVSVSTSSVFDADSFKPRWATVGVPRTLHVLGSNLVAVSPRADGIYSVMIDAVRNAPQLVSDSDTLPIGREYLDVILGYAAHLAAFKQGGAEFQATYGDYDAFVKTALGYTNRMGAQNFDFPTLVDRVKREEEQVALRQEQVA